jgi:hypothetical protein
MFELLAPTLVRTLATANASRQSLGGQIASLDAGE